MKFLQTLFIFFLVSVAQASTLIWDRTEARVAMKPEQAVAKAEYTLTNNSDAPQDIKGQQFLRLYWHSDRQAHTEPRRIDRNNR